MHTENLMLGLEIMGKGMAGIFAVVIVIMAGIMLMNCIKGDSTK